MNTTIGGCLHLINGFVCSEGRYQNYPCPYGNNINKCPCSIEVTEKMAKQWNEEGCITLSFSELKYNPLERNR
jgi:hypothetical protein